MAATWLLAGKNRRTIGGNHDRSLDHRRLPHAARHRQGRQGRAGRHPSAAAGGHRAEGASPSATTSTPPKSTTSSGAPSSQRGKQGGDLGRMAALDAGYDIKASGVTLDRFCGSGITIGQPGRGLDHVGHGRPGHRRRHRDDVLHRRRPPIRTRPAVHGQRQPAPARPPSADRTRASAPTPSPRWKASRARRSTSWRWSASSAPTRRSRAAISTRAWCPSTTRTARWRSTTRNSRARRPRWKASPR